MPKGKLTTPYQEKQVIALYQQDDIPVNEILKLTGIGSPSTLYRILDAHHIPRKPKMETGNTKTFYIEEDVLSILKDQPDTSQYLNEAIRYYHQKEKNK